MRIRLSDGTYLEVNSSSSTNIPSKRTVKNKKGVLKRWSSSSSGANVGGTKNSTTAIYKGFDVDPNDPSVVVLNRMCPEATCITVNSRTRKFTWDVGGSCSTGYIGGKGA
jgi:hypothetical protein